jgi:hypothetical protein
MLNKNQLNDQFNNNCKMNLNAFDYVFSILIWNISNIIFLQPYLNHTVMSITYHLYFRIMLTLLSAKPARRPVQFLSNLARLAVFPKLTFI